MIAHRRNGGMHGLGETQAGGLVFASNALIAPEFNEGLPGTYSMDVVIRGVPIATDKRPYFDPSEWNASLAAAGRSNVTVTGVQFVLMADSNARSTGGSFDIFGAGVDVSDVTYRLTFVVNADAGQDSGMGVITTLGWIAIAALVVAVDLLIYKLTGVDAIVSVIRWISGSVLPAAIIPAVGALVPVLVVAALALLVFTKMGGRGSWKGFSIGGGS